jgi:hypothetical protein
MSRHFLRMVARALKYWLAGLPGAYAGNQKSGH